jgi:hypothetical protein
VSHSPATWDSGHAEPFVWEVQQHPDGTSALRVILWPFTYNASTLQERFYKDLPFEEEIRRVEAQRRPSYVAVIRPKKTLVLASILSLPRDLAHTMGAQVRGGDQYTADTIASTFLAELGP